jgi:hypothetical protein
MMSGENQNNPISEQNPPVEATKKMNKDRAQTLGERELIFEHEENRIGSPLGVRYARRRENGIWLFIWKEERMKFHPTRHFLRLCVWLAVVFLLAGVSISCKGKKAETAEKVETAAKIEIAETPDQLSGLRTILGEAKEDYPGVQDIEQMGNELTIYYRFIPKDTNTLQEELGEDLAPKIKKIYETDKAVDVLRFAVSIPFTEETGGTSFKRQLSFTMTKKIFVETDWTGLLSRDFLKIVQDLKAEE